MNAPTSALNSTRNHRPLLSLLCMSAALACGIVSAAMADDTAALPEVLLNGDSINVPAPESRLIRTSQTPSELTLNVPIGMANTVCAESAQVPHTGQNGAQCGYDHLVRSVCRDIPGPCHVIDARTGRQACAPTTRQCGLETIDQARICTWLETQCVRTEVVQSTETREVKMKFKNVASLGAGETETYELRGTQNRLDGSAVSYSLSAISTKRPVSIKSRDGIFTGFKHVLQIKGN